MAAVTMWAFYGKVGTGGKWFAYLKHGKWKVAQSSSSPDLREEAVKPRSQSAEILCAERV